MKLLHAPLKRHRRSETRPAPSRTRGLTLIELTIGLAVAALLLTLAGPSFQTAVNNGRLSSAASEFIAAVQLARSEAIRANRRVVLCRSVDGSACDSTSATWPGWIMFTDLDADGVRDANEPLIKVGSFDAPVVATSSAAITSLSQAIVFRGDGTARASDGISLLTGTLAVCMPTLEPGQNVRAVTLASGTRTSVRRINAGGACAAPADS